MSLPPLSRAVPKPGHVPQSLVYDFDMFYDPAYNANPHDRVLDLLENAPPVFWTPRHGGHWIAVTHEANFQAARDSATFSSEIMPYSKISKLMTLQKMLGFFGIGGGRIPLPTA